MATPAPRRSARIAAKMGAVDSAPANGGAGKAPAVKAVETDAYTKHKAWEESIIAKYEAMTPEQRAKEYSAKMYVIETAKSIKADIKAMIDAPAEEITIKAKDIIARITRIHSICTACIDDDGEGEYLEKAIKYINGANGIDRDGHCTCEDCAFFMTEAKIRASYIRDAEDSIDSFIMVYSPHYAICP